MKPWAKRLLAIYTGSLLTACTIGNWHICGPQTPTANCNKAAYDALTHPKPYIQKWEKTGATPEERAQDSGKCGGGTSLTHSPGFSEKDTEEAKLPGESWRETYERLSADWQRCMLKKGYRYTGQCETEFAKTRPSCGAP